MYYQWVQSNFDSLLRVMPECVDFYMGVDKNDVSQRRYTIVPLVEVVIVAVPDLKISKRIEKKENSDSEDNSDADEEGISEEEKASREAFIARRKEQEHQRHLANEKLMQEAERKRNEAMAARERGDDVSKVKQLSKKEIEEKRKSKQGVRTSKTGSKATKYAGEGSAVEKAKSGAAGKKKK